MKKLLLLTITVILVMAAASFATDTRVLTMGDNNNIMLDDANIWLYPSRIGFHPDLAVAEFGYYLGGPILDTLVNYGPGEEMSRFGVNFKFGSDNPRVVGLYLHNNAPFDHMYSPLLPIAHGPIDFISRSNFSNKRIDLFYGQMFGENNIGLHFGLVNSSFEFDAESLLDNDSYTQFNIDLGGTFAGGKMDVAVGIEKFSFKNLDTHLDSTVYKAYDTYKDEGNMGYYFRGRYFYEYNPSYAFVPHLAFMHGTYEAGYYTWKGNTFDTTEHYINELRFTRKYTVTDFDIGVGLHYTPATSVLAILDFGVRSNNVKREMDYDSTYYSWDDYSYETQDKNFAMPYFKVGFEADVFRWLDIRFGATSYWNKYTYESETTIDGETTSGKYHEKYPLNKTYLGLGFNWDRLHVDCYTDPELFLNGFDFISGGGEGSMNFQISAMYEMF